MCIVFYTYFSSDLHLGDAHVISVDDVLSRHEGNDMVGIHNTIVYEISFS